MFEVGRVCVKIAGRDAGKKCAIIEVIDQNFVMIDGETRRRKCNKRHLEPLDTKLEIGKNASSAEVANALGIEQKKEAKEKQAAKTERPKSSRKQKEKPVKEAKPVKEKKAPKAAKKAEKTESEKEKTDTA